MEGGKAGREEATKERKRQEMIVIWTCATAGRERHVTQG